MPDPSPTDARALTADDLAAATAVLRREEFLDPEREPTTEEHDPELWTALFSYAQAQELEWSIEAFEDEDGMVPVSVIDALHRDAKDSGLEAPVEALSFAEYPAEPVSFSADDMDLSEVPVFDVTKEHELKKGRKWPRKPEKITTIVLHQTGVQFGTTRRNREKYGERVALHRRFYNVACHAAALMNGDVVLVNGWRRYVYHGDTSNKFSIGIEIEGLYAGIAGNRKTVWKQKEPNVLSARTVAAARRAVQLAVEQCRELGCPITQIAAHRSFSNSRIADPGEEIWRDVALWAVDNLGLEIDYDLVHTRKKGRKVPVDWDPGGLVDYRGRPLKNA